MVMVAAETGLGILCYAGVAQPPDERDARSRGLEIYVSDHFKPASNYRNDPATQVGISRHFSSKQARYKLLLWGLFERKMPLS